MYCSPAYHSGWSFNCLEGSFAVPIWFKTVSKQLILITRIGYVGRTFARLRFNQGYDLGRHKRRWEDNIGKGLEERGIKAGNWVDSALDIDYWRALVNA